MLFKKVVISPPLDQFPDISLKGKSVVISFKEPLKLNTTYTVNVGDAIKDITEGNVMKGFSFVFSTGPKLDSLQISGLVLDAEKSQVVEDVIVMLYKDLSDSAVYKHKPYYFGRTDKSGKFTIEHLQEGTYKLFALKDANFNLIYDQLSEPIAFSDTSIIIVADTSVKDSTKKPTPKITYRLSLFTQQNSKITLSDAISPSRKRINTFSPRPLTNYPSHH